MTGLSGKCPSCDAGELVWGTILLPLNETLRFMPYGLPGGLAGFPVEAFACRGCGHIGLHLSLEQRKKLEQAPISQTGILGLT